MTGVFKKAQQSYKKHKSFHFYTIYLYVYQWFTSVAFCCVFVAFPMFLAQRLRIKKMLQKKAQQFALKMAMLRFLTNIKTLNISYLNALLRF